MIIDQIYLGLLNTALDELRSQQGNLTMPILPENLQQGMEREGHERY